MKKLKLSFGKEMTKEQMKKVTGGYNCPSGPTVYVCQTYGGGGYFGCVPCDGDCMDTGGPAACSSAGYSAFLWVLCASDINNCEYH
nr:hypothetical protein [uncultured Mucilaginibacter sp.]